MVPSQWCWVAPMLWCSSLGWGPGCSAGRVFGHWWGLAAAGVEFVLLSSLQQRAKWWQWIFSLSRCLQSALTRPCGSWRFSNISFSFICFYLLEADTAGHFKLLFKVLFHFSGACFSWLIWTVSHADPVWFPHSESWSQWCSPWWAGTGEVDRRASGVRMSKFLVFVM